MKFKIFVVMTVIVLAGLFLLFVPESGAMSSTQSHLNKNYPEQSKSSLCHSYHNFKEYVKTYFKGSISPTARSFVGECGEP